MVRVMVVLMMLMVGRMVVSHSFSLIGVGS